MREFEPFDPDKEFKPLEVDFKIPPILQESINGLVKEVNEGGLAVDCWQDDLRASINICVDGHSLTEEDGALLRRYYYNRNLRRNI